LVRDGLTNEQIATRLGISMHGAKYYVSEILSKLGVSSREDAVHRVEEERRSFSTLPFMPSIGKAGLFSKLGAPFIAGGMAVTGAVLALFLVNPGGILGSDSAAPLVTREPEIEVDVSQVGEADAASIARLARQAEGRVTSEHPEAALVQIDLGGRSVILRFVVRATTCEDPSSLASNLGHPDKCEIDVTVSGLDAAAEQWQISRPYYSRLSVGVRPPIQWSEIGIGPRAVGVSAEKEWPGCTPRNLTLATVPGPQAWTVFCVQPDGGIFRGTADPRTGAFSPEPGPVYPPAVATPMP